MDHSPEDDSITLSSPSRPFAAAIFVVFALGALAATVFGESAADWKRFFLYPLIAVAAVVLAVRSARSGVTCTADGVVAVIESRTYRFHWSEILQFEQRGLLGIGAVLTTGKWVALIYYATLGDVSQEMATAKLEDARKRFQPGSSPTAG